MIGWKKKTFTVDEHSACLIHYALLLSLARARTELSVIIISKDRDLDAAEKILLPHTLKNATREKLREQIDAWVSLVAQIEHWVNGFDHTKWE